MYLSYSQFSPFSLFRWLEILNEFFHFKCNSQYYKNNNHTEKRERKYFLCDPFFLSFQLNFTNAKEIFDFLTQAETFVIFSKLLLLILQKMRLKISHKNFYRCCTVKFSIETKNKFGISSMFWLFRVRNSTDSLVFVCAFSKIFIHEMSNVF